MRRRDFMKLTAAAGLTAVSPWAHGRACPEPMMDVETPLWITVNLRGGWDTTWFCDPRTRDVMYEDETGPRGPINQGYDQTATIGALTYAPGTHYGPEGTLEFLAERGFTVINGVDAGLTSHSQGERLAMTGGLKKTAPTLTALIAANVVSAGVPRAMPYLTFGGYDLTANLVAPTRLTKMDLLGKVTRPNLSPDTQENGLRFHDVETANAIDAAVRARTGRFEERTRLAGWRRALNQLHLARCSQEDVGRFAANFDESYFNGPVLANNDFKRQIYTSLIAFEQGLSVSAGLVINGWDTHVENDGRQRSQINYLFGGLRFLVERAEALGLRRRLNVVISSEFSRSPYYNLPGAAPEGKGKDHHPISSWMTMLWGLGREDGVRVVGRTDERMLAAPMAVGPVDAVGRGQAGLPCGGEQQPCALFEDPGGTKLSPMILHNELRHLAGLDGSPLLDVVDHQAKRWPIWG
jgi:hypothetical protein